MNNRKLQAAIALLSLLAIFNPLLALAGKPPAKKPAQTTQPAKPTDPYQKAKKELPTNYYIAYILMDRILRANGLAKTPWRLVVTGAGEVVNATSSDYNLISLDGGLFAQLDGSPDALACAVGHEVGHLVKQHLGFGPKMTAQATVQAEMEAEAEKKRKKKTGGILGTIGRTAGEISNTFGVGGLGGRLLGTTERQTTIESEKIKKNEEERNQEIDRETQEKIKVRVTEINHKQEIEADESGYIYAVKAGFPSEGCLTMLDILGRGDGGHLGDETHPGASERKEKLEKFMAENPPETLKTEGADILKTTKPLLYENFKSKGVDDEGKTYTLSGLKIKPPSNTTTALEGMIKQ